MIDQRLALLHNLSQDYILGADLMAKCLDLASDGRWDDFLQKARELEVIAEKIRLTTQDMEAAARRGVTGVVS